MTKAEARNTYLEKRKALLPKDRCRLDELMLIQLQKASLPFIHYLFSFWPAEHLAEPDTHLLTDYLEFMNPDLQVCYPVTAFEDYSMQAVRCHDDTGFIKNKYGIMEPREGTVIEPLILDMIFVPLLAIDREGCRAGYGKGFYDRYLSRCRKDCLKVGFSYFEPIDQLADKDEFDIPLDLCVTPTNHYVF